LKRAFYILGALLLFLLAVNVAVFISFSVAKREGGAISLVVRDGGEWEREVLKSLLSYAEGREELYPEEVKRFAQSLPWVKRARVKQSTNRLIVEIEEVRPAYYLVVSGKFYLVGENGMVLAQEERAFRELPVYYYEGKSLPFIADGPFLKVQKTVKMELELVGEKLKKLKSEGENPQIVMSDAFITLVFREKKAIVRLSLEERGWDNFFHFFRLTGGIIPGLYDFRFYDMLIRGGGNAK